MDLLPTTNLKYTTSISDSFMKKLFHAIAATFFFSLLLSGNVFGKGVVVNISKGGANNPQWLSVAVAHEMEDLYSVVIHIKGRNGIAGYDMHLRPSDAELKGLLLPVKLHDHNPGHAASMNLPKCLLTKTVLVLKEQIEDANGGSYYVIDLASFLPKEKGQGAIKVDLKQFLVGKHCLFEPVSGASPDRVRSFKVDGTFTAAALSGKSTKFANPSPSVAKFSKSAS